MQVLQRLLSEIQFQEMSITSDIYSTKQIRIPKILCDNFQGLGTGGAGTDIIIGNDNTKTSAVYIGKEEQTILGTVYPAIPTAKN